MGRLASGLLLVLVCWSVWCSGDDLEELTQRYFDMFLASAPSNLDQIITSWMGTLSSQGTWPDIDYSDQSRADWNTEQHLGRVKAFCLGLELKGQKWYQNPELKQKTLLALNLWLVKDFQNPNWWWNMIGVPTDMGEIALLLGQSPLTPQQVSKCIQIMERANWNGFTGANIVWMATVHSYNGCFMKNLTYTKEAFNKIYETSVITAGSDDGIKQDGSFFQHDRQVYSGGYGADFTGDILSALNETNGLSSFAIPGDNLAAFAHNVLDGQQWMANGLWWDISVKGREITRPSQTKFYFNPRLVEVVPGPRHQEFVTFAQRIANGGKTPLLVGNKQFWKSDYMIHRKASFSISTKMFSTRTRNSECVNTEGKQSLHLADGATYIYMNGDEYFNIFPVWDWKKIPGTTCEQDPKPLSCSEVSTIGTTSFVGGVSDGNYGISAFNYSSPLSGTTTANKAWFFFDEGFVALGTAIHCKTTNPVITSVNQCLLRSSVYTSSSPSTALPKGRHTFSNVWWVHHDNVGYIFDKQSPPQLNLLNDAQVGSWALIGVGSDSPVTEDVFNMWIDHGSTPVRNANYTYIAIPGVDLQSFTAKVQQYEGEISILSNTETLQAVFNTKLNLLQIIFWKPGTAKVLQGWVVSADKPSIVQVSKTPDNKVSISVSNPQQDTINNQVVVTLNQKLSGNGCVVQGGNTLVKFSLPTGEYAGSSTTITCLLQSYLSP